MSVPLRLWLVRHGPVLAPSGTCYGQLDLPADPKATARSAERLALILPREALLQYSTLQRCELLALSVQALRPDLNLKSDERLREYNFGTWEGRAWASLARAEIDAWTAQLATYRPGGGESLMAMLARVGEALRETCAMACETRQDAVWVAHAGVARCVQWLLSSRARAGRLPCSAHWPTHAPAPGEWAIYDLNASLSSVAGVVRSSQAGAYDAPANRR